MKRDLLKKKTHDESQNQDSSPNTVTADAGTQFENEFVAEAQGKLNEPKLVEEEPMPAEDFKINGIKIEPLQIVTSRH